MEPKGWVCLWRTTLRDEKVRSLTDRQKWVWMGLLCMASQNGKTTGHIINETTGTPLSIREIAGELGVDHTTVARAIDRMTSAPLKMLRVLEPAQGRKPALLQVVNFRRYQYVDGVAPAQHKPASVAVAQQSEEATVADSVAEAQRNAQQSGLLQECNTNRGEAQQSSLFGELETVALEQHKPDKKYKKRRSTPTSKDSSVADDADGGDEKPMTDNQLREQAMHEAYLAVMGEETPKGTLEGWASLKKALKAEGIPTLRRWVALFAGQTAEVPEGADRWNWFCKQASDILRNSWKLDQLERGNGGNGPERPTESRTLQGWPARLAAEDLRAQFTDDELADAARSPDYWSFPFGNVNGSEQQRLEKAHRQYEREQASG